MKLNLIIIFLINSVLSSCVSIPKEAVELSRVVENDLIVLQNSHEKMVELYYNEVIEDINSFVDDVYSPFVINYVLKDELQRYKNKEESIYTTLEKSGQNSTKIETDEALKMMTEFLFDANAQIEKKRSELLNPIIEQKNITIQTISESYKSVRSSNATITDYLESIRETKEAQQEVLSVVGLEGKDQELDELLLQTSKLTKSVLEKGHEIDVNSDEAYLKIQEIIDLIKNITDFN